jgi:chromate transporter
LNLFVLYLLLLKATMTSFTGPSSLPMIHQELVVQRKAITDGQLAASVAIGRSTPGPNGVYVVAVGYFVAGAWGAGIGWLALITPALVILLLLRLLGSRAEHPTVKAIIDAVIIASVGLVVVTIPRLASALGGSWLGYAIAALSAFLLIRTRIHTAFVVAVGAFAMMAAMLR